ncbi:methyl-accepting chemotaxis protein [Rummeliibacillus pycnus]|uniref:methyl-accepting chemotaxis protein n=1 Tax=Rummeliibacillus pycnus TaxID=101070 RepID=UPI003D2BDEC8
MKFLIKNKHSILLKYILTLVIPIAIFSMIFGGILYFSSSKIINAHVISLFENNLQLVSEEVMTHIDSSLVRAADTNEQTKYDYLLNILNTAKDKHNIENAYVLSRADGKEHIVALSDTDKHNTAYKFDPNVNTAIDKQTIQFSDIYTDTYGIHKSIFVPIVGTEIVLGVDMDASFISKIKSQTLWISIGLTVLFVIIGAIIAIIISRRMIKPMIDIKDYVGKVAQGNLAAERFEVIGKDEIAQVSHGVYRMVDELSSIISQITTNAEQVATTAEELSAGSEQTTASIEQVTGSMQEVAAGSEKQTDGIEEISNNVHDISNKMDQITIYVEKVSTKANDTTKTAENGNEIIQNAVKKMDITKEMIQSTSEVVNRLDNYSKEIGQIVSLITEIADQTNLLALNASIEAARAGEHGKGFAVVAEEVRKLADQSREAANDISNRIDSIKIESTNAVESMSTSYENLQGSAQAFDQAGDAFTEIYTAVSDLTSQMSKVSKSIESMDVGINNIAGSMEKVSVIVVQNSSSIQNVAAASEEQTASMEEITAASTNLAGMAEQLQITVNKFKL